MAGQVLGELSRDRLTHIPVQDRTQVGKRARRCDDEYLVRLAGPYQAFERLRDFPGEAVLLKVVPVGLIHAAANISHAGKCPAGTVAALLVGGRIVVQEYGL